MDRIEARRTARYRTKPARLVRGTRSIWHPWFLWIAAAGGAAMALMVPMAALLAAAEPGSHSGRELWTIAVIVVATLAFVALVVCAGCGVAAILTRPVRDGHDATLKATARSLSQSLDQSFSNYGAEGYRPEQAFRAHFKKITDRLDTWDGRRSAAAEAQRLLGEHIDASMVEHGVLEPDYVVSPIKTYVRGLAMSHAEGHIAEPPRFEWARSSSAGNPPPAYGVIGPDSGIDWILAPPLDGETWEQWEARTQALVDGLEHLIDAVFASSLSAAQVALRTKGEVERFQQESVPALREALHLVYEREPSRARLFRCETC